MWKLVRVQKEPFKYEEINKPDPKATVTKRVAAIELYNALQAPYYLAIGASLSTLLVPVFWIFGTGLGMIGSTIAFSVFAYFIFRIRQRREYLQHYYINEKKKHEQNRQPI